ncbi:hypothetical protein AVEN_30595-1 [Araneus ventricosus]|uniref:Uncharacterized protein n=1 Tax=Araneus ventricosus TaxID=182803 RepID=A0A4Y2ERI9_ARAVE|nr:hypothetical protein AVEN_30595-1 [Araneus ventricosus]
MAVSVSRVGSTQKSDLHRVVVTLSVGLGEGRAGSLFLSLDELLCPGDVLVSEEEGILDSDVVVDVVEVPGVLAGHGVLGEGAGERELVEDGLVAAEEAVVHGLLIAVGVGDGVAHVEDLAVVVDVSVVAVSETVAVEVGVDGSDDQFHSVGKEEGLTLHLGDSNHINSQYTGLKTWESILVPPVGWVPLLTCGTQPNRGYQNRPLGE